MLLRNSAILAFFSVISLLLGIVRDRLLAHYVGVGAVLDVYNASFRIPDLIYGILFSFVSAVTVVPFITKAVHDNDEKELEVRFNSLLFFFSGVLVLFSFIVIITLPLFAHYIAPGFSLEQLDLFILSSRILMVQPLFLGLSALISCLAQVRHRFILYSTAPLMYTVCIILSIIFLYEPYGLLGIIFGVVLGSILSFLFQSYGMYKEKISISFSMFNWDVLKEHLVNALPRSGSMITSRIREVIFAAIATSIGVGALSVYVFAQRVMDAFIQVVVQSASTASLPFLAKHHSHGEANEYKNVLTKNIIAIFSLSCLASLICVTVPHLIVSILYGNGAGTSSIVSLVVLLSLSLPLYSINVYFVSAFNASKDGKGLFLANLFSSTLGIVVLYLSYLRGYGLNSLAYATWAVSIFYLLSLVYFYRNSSKYKTL